MDTRISLLCLLLMLIPLAVAMSVVPPQVKATSAPEYDALFQRENDWVGADGNFSVDLGGGRLLWLFGDTFVGKVKDGRRVDCVMINNSAAIQRVGTTQPVEFFYQTMAEGRPQSFMLPSDGRGYLWPMHGVRVGKGFSLFLLRVKPDNTTTAFPFKVFGSCLGYVADADAPPSTWKVRQAAVPFSKFEEKGSIVFGSAVLRQGQYVYIYGIDSLRKDAAGKQMSAMVLARAPAGKLGDFSAWRFYARGKWVKDYAESDAVCPGQAVECLVSYMPALKQYAAVYMEGVIFGSIMVRLAPKPEGPWGEPIKVYECPDKSWHKGAYCYMVKGHPELSRAPNELIVTYSANSFEFKDLFEDARLYWPRFMRVTFRRNER